MTFVAVEAAGHMVPMDQPQVVRRHQDVHYYFYSRNNAGHPTLLSISAHPIYLVAIKCVHALTKINNELLYTNFRDDIHTGACCSTPFFCEQEL